MMENTKKQLFLLLLVIWIIGLVGYLGYKISTPPEVFGQGFCGNDYPGYYVSFNETAGYGCQYDPRIEYYNCTYNPTAWKCNIASLECSNADAYGNESPWCLYWKSTTDSCYVYAQRDAGTCTTADCYLTCTGGATGCTRTGGPVNKSCWVSGGDPTPTPAPTPTPVPNNVAGSHDGFSGTQYSSECRAAGWSTDPDDTSQKVEIRFRTRISGGTWGSWVGAGQANLYRSDLESVCPGSNGYCAFDFSLLNNVEFDVAYDVAVQGRDINTGNYVNLSNTPRTITCVEPSQNTCSISATPAQTNEGEYTQVLLTGTVEGDGGSVPEVRVWVSKQNQSNIPNYNLSSVISPQPVSEYQNPSPSIYYYHIHAAGCTPGSGTNSCSNTANLYLPQGDYYLHCDVPDDPGKCSGNPYCDYEALGPNLINCTAGGWQSCSGNDNLTYQVFPAPAQCTVNLTPNTYSISVGGSQQYLADVIDVQGGTVDRVDFRSLQTSVATVSPTSDPTPAYQTTATGVSTGDATIQADVVMGGANICSDTASLTVTPPGPWWQVRDADVMAAGSISSIIPVTCTPTACTPSFNLKGTGDYPGVNIFGGTFSVGTNPDATAGEDYSWLANTTYAGKNPDGSQKRYGLNFFYNQLPEDVKESMNNTTQGRITSSSPGSTFWTGIGNGPAPIIRGYRWYYYDGNDGHGTTLNIEGNINLTGSTRRVVLFVANANLSINGRINVQDGVSFFMAVVGKSGTSDGRITVNQAVGGTGGPHLEGIFLAERDLLTSASANRLHVRGSVVAYDGVSLDRDLVDANVNTSAELFEYGVDQVMLIPPQMMLRKILWQEVLP